MINTGDTVKMSNKLKSMLMKNGSHDHVTEFGDCEGIVENEVWKNCTDVNVRWKPSMLRYIYGIEDLVKIDK